MTSFKDKRYLFARRLRIYVLVLTILIYGAFGFPTPDQPGLIEALIGLGLLFCLGIPQAAFSLLTKRDAEPLWMKPARLLVIYGLSVPVIMGLVLGNGMGAMMRDLFPFLFMMLPFFAYPLWYASGPKIQPILIGSILLAGLMFAARGYLAFSQTQAANIEALYLANAPTVLFTALFLSGYAFMHFRFSNWTLPLFCAGISLLPMAAMGAALQRASFGAVCLSLLAIWSLVLRRSLLRAAFLIVCIMCAITLILPSFLPLIIDLLEKNRLVGTNMRLLELNVVWERVVESAPTVLFGQGWGSTYASPAVGGLTVNFTHSLLSSALLKTGLIGTLFTLSYLGTLLMRFPYLFKLSPVLAIALFWPFVIDIFLYASYKSLDFGFILMLIACYGLSNQKSVSSENGWNAKKNSDDQQGLSSRPPPDRAVVV